MITSNKLGLAFQRHINAISHLYYHHFNNGGDLEPLTREALMHVDNFQQLLIDFRAQEETRKCNVCSCQKYTGTKRAKNSWTTCECGHIAQDHS